MDDEKIEIQNQNILGLKGSTKTIETCLVTVYDRLDVPSRPIFACVTCPPKHREILGSDSFCGKVELNFVDFLYSKSNNGLVMNADTWNSW